MKQYLPGILISHVQTTWFESRKSADKIQIGLGSDKILRKTDETELCVQELGLTVSLHISIAKL